MLRFTILGCGTSVGVPVIHCDCNVCRSDDPKNARLRASVWLEVDGKHFVVDTSTDFRAQALRAKIPRIDAVLLTHPHADHIGGLDDLRTFNFVQRESIPVYGNQWTYDNLHQRFPYIFEPGTPEGGGIPQLELNLVDPGTAELEITGVKFTVLPVEHGSQQVLGFRHGAFAYVTDCSYIPDTTLARMQDLEVLVLDCVRTKPHRTHFNVDRALETVQSLRPKQVFLTHLSHEFDYEEWNKKLPAGVELAYDGLAQGV